MASVACDSPVRRFTAKQNKENSPVELNRLKSLLKKKVGDNGSASGSSASPKKAATPRKEVKVKRGATLKLCSSCADHNKDLDEVKNDGEAKKTRTASKKNTESQGQGVNLADDKKNAVEKKAAVKKPRETKKKAGAQGEMLDMPSTSGTAPSMTKSAVPTDSGNQMKDKSKPKRQRKRVDTSVKQADSVVEMKQKSNSKAKSKNIIKVKVPQPRKIAKNLSAGSEKAPFENMDVTDLINSIYHSEETMESSAFKSDDKQKQKKKELMVHFEPHSTSTDSLTNEHETSGNSSESKNKRKNEDATTSKIPRLKKTSKKLPVQSEEAPFENMDVTDLVNSARRERTIEKSDGSTKQKPKKTVYVTPLTNANDNLIGLPSNNNRKKEVVCNSEDMFKNDSSINSLKRKESINFSSSSEAPELQVNQTVKTQRGTKDESASTTSKVNSLTEGDSSTNRDMSIDTMLNHEVHNPLDEVLSDFNFDISDTPIPSQVITRASTGEKINLSASTNLSRDDATVEISMNISNEINTTSENSLGKNSTLTSNIDILNNIDNVPAHSSIHHDETFPREHLPNDTIEKINKSIANITLRAKQSRKDKNNVNAAQNISSDGVISFTQKDSNCAMTVPVFNRNDETFFNENQQPLGAGIGCLTPIKLEPEDDIDYNSSKTFPDPQSSVSSGSHKTGNVTKKSEKSISKVDELKLKSKASKVLESTEKKSKSCKLPKKNDSPKKASKEPAKKLVIPSPPKSKKKSSDDEKKSARRLEKKRRMSKQLKKDLIVAKAIEGMSHHFSKISIGTTIGTINELHIGFSSDSDSSSECSTDCSCNEFSSESSGDQCKCLRCVRRQDYSSDSSDTGSSSDEDESDTESSLTDSSSSSSSSASEEIRCPIKKPAKKEKKIVKPTYKEKLSKYYSKYDLRSNTSRYDLRSHDH